MQGWIVFGAWLFAIVLAAVLLGFCGYEVAWKSRRLQRDTARLNRLVGELAAVSADLSASAERARTSMTSVRRGEGKQTS